MRDAYDHRHSTRQSTSVGEHFSPASGASVVQGTTLTFAGSASDPEDGVLG